MAVKLERYHYSSRKHDQQQVVPSSVTTGRHKCQTDVTHKSLFTQFMIAHSLTQPQWPPALLKELEISLSTMRVQRVDRQRFFWVTSKTEDIPAGIKSLFAHLISSLTTLLRTSLPGCHQHSFQWFRQQAIIIGAEWVIAPSFRQLDKIRLLTYTFLAKE